jgi:hypothetical protein
MLEVTRVQTARTRTSLASSLEFAAEAKSRRRRMFVAMKGGVMAKDDREILQVLESELDFLNKGGYGRSVRTPREPTIPFQDSPICPEYPCRTHNDECLLMQFVPESERSAAVPCHHIPLNDTGDTVERLLAEQGRERAEEELKRWLRHAIDILKQGDGGRTIPVA